MRLCQPISTLFPYTTLFRSQGDFRADREHSERSAQSGREHGEEHDDRERRAESGAGIEWRAAKDFERGDRGLQVRARSEEHTSELQSPDHLVCRLLLEKKKK